MSLSPKILVTGANGMIGSALISKLLEEGKTVRAFAFKESKALLKHSNLECFYGNILDIGILDDICKDVETIYHCEEMVSFNVSEEDKMYKINVIGTENLVNAALTNKVQKIIYLSSSLSFGTYLHKKEINENTKWIQHNENTFYSICKNRAELEITRAKEEGLETVILNPSLILGKATNSIYNLINIANANYRFYPSGVNGFVGLDDVVNICLEVLNKNLSGEKFILNAENLSYKEVLEQINPKLVEKNIFSRVNSTKVKLICKINQFRNIIFGAKPFLTKEIFNFHQKDFYFSNEKTTKTFDFKFTPISKVIEELK